MSGLKNFCGIDVSSSSLDFIVLSKTDSTKISAKGIRSRAKDFVQIPNTATAIKSKFSQAVFDDTLFILETTGTYSSKLLHELSKIGRPISVVSPYQSKSYMASKGITNKNDKNAAFCLAKMGKNEELRLYKAPSMEMQERKQLISAHWALEKQARMLGNQIHALEQYPQVNQLAISALQEVLDPLNKQFRDLKNNSINLAKTPTMSKK